MKIGYQFSNAIKEIKFVVSREIVVTITLDHLGKSIC